jgi:hypothetical protein
MREIDLSQGDCFVLRNDNEGDDFELRRLLSGNDNEGDDFELRRLLSGNDNEGDDWEHPGFANMQKYDIFVNFFKLPTRTLLKNLF